jgi:hypothetical protein
LTYAQFVVPPRNAGPFPAIADGHFQVTDVKALFLAQFLGKVPKNLMASGFRRFRARILTKLSTGFVDKEIAFVLPGINRLNAGRF